MPEPTLGGFSPFNEAHAIVTVQATIQFAGPVSDAQWATMQPAIRNVGRQLDLERPNHAFGLAVSFDGSKLGITLNSPSVNSHQVMGLHFSSFDNNDSLLEKLSANKDAIQAVSNQYVRWKPFSGRFEQFAKEIFKYYSYERPIALIQLEYWDRFDLIDSSNPNPASIISAESPWVIPSGATHVEPWHSHAGRFERISDKVRRLVQSNVDYADLPTKGGNRGRSIAIYTMMQDATNAPGYSKTVGMGWSFEEVMDVLDRQHQALKDELRRIITPEAAERIGL